MTFARVSLWWEEELAEVPEEGDTLTLGIEGVDRRFVVEEVGTVQRPYDTPEFVRAVTLRPHRFPAD